MYEPDQVRSKVAGSGMCDSSPCREQEGLAAMGSMKLTNLHIAKLRHEAWETGETAVGRGLPCLRGYGRARTRAVAHGRQPLNCVDLGILFDYELESCSSMTPGG